MPEVFVRWLANGEMVEGGLESLTTACASGFAWVDVLGPDEPTLSKIAEQFGLHPLAVEDCLHYPQRPKIDEYRSGLFIIWLTAQKNGSNELVTHELDVFLGKDHLITVHREPVQVISDLATHCEDLVAKGGDFLLHAILDRLVDGSFIVIDALSDQLEGIENVLLSRPDPDQLHRLYRVRRQLVRLHRIVGPERDIIRGIARERVLVNEEAYRYLQDVGDHLARVQDSVDTGREVAAAAMDIYLSSVSNRMNEIMKVLTVVATIFMPLTLISGIYGMNLIRGMWPPPSATWSFPAVVLMMLVIAAWMIWFFKRRKWW